MAQDSPPSKADSPGSTALVAPPTLEELDRAHTSNRRRQSGVTLVILGGSSATAVAIAMYLQQHFDLFLPTYVGMPLAMILALVLMRGSSMVARRVPWPFDENTPLHWRTDVDERIFRYAESCQDRLLDMAGHSQGVKPEWIQSLFPRLLEALKVYRSLTWSIRKLERETKAYGDKVPQRMKLSKARLEDRWKKADATVQTILNAYGELYGTLLEREGQTSDGSTDETIENIFKALQEDEDVIQESAKETERARTEGATK